MKNRIQGIDVARALSIIGMIIVNFKVVIGDKGQHWVKSFAALLDGKAAATFVVLAGVGLALMTNKHITHDDESKLIKVRNTILKRALFLFVVGTLYTLVWPADILHFYGVYMVVTLLLLRSNSKTILLTAISLIVIYPILMTQISYDTGWNFETLDYSGFWSIKGFIRNLFYNGFHPVIPWTAFMLFGLWLGKQDLRSDHFVKKIFWFSTVTFMILQAFSYLSIHLLSEGSPATVHDLRVILGTSPMPPLPIYMFSGTAIAFTVISACILVARRFECSIVTNVLSKTGQLALTFYVAHIIIGVGILEAYNSINIGSYATEFSVVYALVFSACCMLFAVIWRKYKKQGPLEWIMRKMTD